MGVTAVTTRKIATKKGSPRSDRELRIAIEAQKKRQKCLDLRAAGATLQQIVDTPGTFKDKGSVSRAIKEALAEITLEPAEDLLKIELQRLDAMQLAIWPAARQGDVFAIDRVLKIQTQRARYLGLEPPNKEDASTADVKTALAGFLGQIVERANQIEAPETVLGEVVDEP